MTVAESTGCAQKLGSGAAQTAWENATPRIAVMRAVFTSLIGFPFSLCLFVVVKHNPPHPPRRASSRRAVHSCVSVRTVRLGQDQCEGVLLVPGKGMHGAHTRHPREQCQMD